MNRCILDVHAHYQPKVLNAFMERFGLGTLVPHAPWTDTSEHMAERARLMDSAGVSLQVLSPGTAHYFEDERVGLEAAQLINDSFGQASEAMPLKLAAYVSLPLPHIDVSLRELDRGSRLPGMIGVTLHCSILGRSVAAADFDPIFDELNRRRALLFLHPCRNGLCSGLLNDFGLAESVGTSMEDTLAVLHMIVRRIPHRYPDIRVIIPHLGGALPMLVKRLDNQLPKAHPDLVELPSITARRFWYDTISHGSEAALRCACEAFGSDRLLPGSDYPFLLLHESYEHTFKYIEEAGITAAAIENIFSRNAQSLLDDARSSLSKAVPAS